MSTTWINWTDGTSNSYTASDSITYTWNSWVDYEDSSSGTVTAEPFSITSAVWYKWSDGLCSDYTCDYTTWDTWNTDVDGVVYDEQIEEFSEGQEERLLEYERKFVEERKEEKRKAEAHEKARKEAEEKARELLLDIIGKDELEVYKRTGRVLVKGKKHDYIIRNVGVVQRIEKDKIQDLCVHLENRHAFPETDNVIALMLLAKADEYGLEKLANKCGISNRPDQLPECANFN